MGRIFSETDIRIFTKLAPETGGNIQSGSGHAFPFILRPVSHRFAQDHRLCEQLSARPADLMSAVCFTQTYI